MLSVEFRHEAINESVDGEEQIIHLAGESTVYA